MGKIILLLFLFPSLSFAFEKVVGISDGDTISVMRDGKVQKVRLAGINAPEKKQAFGNRAKKFTSYLVFGKFVEVRAHDVPYGESWEKLFYRTGKA